MKKKLANLLILVVGVAAFLLAKPIGREVSKYFSGTSSEAEIAALLESSPAGEMYRALMKFYPEDAAYLRDNIVSLLKGGATEKEAFSKMVPIGAEIRKRHAASLRTASDQSLRAILRAQTQMIAVFESDPALCNHVIMFGPAGLTLEQSQKIADLVTATVNPLFSAMHEGEHSPVQRPALSEDGFGNLAVEYLSSGGTEAEFNLVLEPNIDDQRLCGAMLHFLRVLTAAEFPGADALRGEVAVAMNEG